MRNRSGFDHISMHAIGPEKWAEVQRLFDLACDLPPEARADFLLSHCSDEAVRLEAASLLEHSDCSSAAAEAIAWAAADMAQENDPDLRLIGARLGPYKVESIVGHGGMGAVYRASRDDAEFHQQVAIKLVRIAAQAPGTLRRFKQERQILARLSHPNIARLLDGGSTPEGVPYLVMEFIEGEPITKWCRRQSLSLEDRLRLFLRICEAVDYAHGSLVVHRDLKPANILVTKDGTPKLLDFGIAKILEPEPDPDNHSATLTGTQAMTPEYASPEQVRGEPVSTAVDIYALGLILYEVLTGDKAQPMTDRTPGTMARVICESEPPAPALRNPQLAGDLDNIIRMAIRKEPARRYPSVADLSRDIHLHLAGRPVSARPDTMAYRTAKFLRRNRDALRLGLTIAAILCGCLGLVYWLSSPGRPPGVLQVTQLTHTGHATLGGGLAADAAHVYFVERSGGDWFLAEAPMQGGPPHIIPNTPPNPEILDISPDHAELLITGGRGVFDDLPLFAMSTAGGSPRRIGEVSAHAGAWSRDGQSIVFGCGNALYRIKRDGTGLQKLLDTPGRPDSIHIARAPLPEKLRFAVNSGPGVNSYVQWEAAPDGAGLHPLLPKWNTGGRPDADNCGVWTADGKYYLFRSLRGDLTSIWALPEGRRLLGLLPNHPIQIYSTPQAFAWLAPAPDGKHAFFLSGQERRQFVRYDAARRQFMPFLPGVQGRWVSYSTDGRLAYTTIPGEALWGTRSDGSEPLRLTPPNWGVHEPNWSPDGNLIVFGGALLGSAAGIYVIPSRGGTPRAIIPPTGFESHVFWSPDGRSIIFSRFGPTTADQGLYIMDWATRKTTFVANSQGLSRARWSPDGRYLVATHIDGLQIRLMDLRTGRWTLLVSGTGIGPPIWSADSKYVYYQETRTEQPIYRVAIANRQIEQIAGSTQIPQSDLAGYALAGLTPDDLPIASVIRTNSDVYALGLDLP